MTRKPSTREPIDDALDLDVLTQPMDDVEAELEARGIDPQRLAAWAGAVARQRLAEKRLAWQSRAHARWQRALDLQPSVDRTSLPNDRDALMAIVQRMRSSIGAPAELAFRKRAPETADIEELKQLIEELALLEALPDDDA